MSAAGFGRARIVVLAVVAGCSKPASSPPREVSRDAIAVVAPDAAPVLPCGPPMVLIDGVPLARLTHGVAYRDDH